MHKVILYISFLILFILAIEAPSFIRDNILTSYSEIDIGSIYTGNRSILSKSHPTNSTPLIAYTQDGPVVIPIQFNKTLKHSGFSIYFYGIFPQANSVMPKSFDVYSINPEGDEILLDNQKNFRDIYYHLSLKDPVDSTEIKIVINEARYGDTIIMGDLKFYERKSLGLFEGIKKHLGSQNKSILAYFSSIILFTLIIFISGYYPAKYICHQFLTTDICKSNYLSIYAMAPILSFALLSLTSLIYIFFHFDYAPHFFFLYTTISLVIYLAKKDYYTLTHVKSHLFFFITAIVITTLLQINRDFMFNLNYIEKYLDTLRYVPMTTGYYGYHADNTLQWGISRMYLNRVSIFSTEADLYRISQGGKAVFDRTPMLPLIITPILKIFGESHFIYQRFLTVLMGTFYLSLSLCMSAYFKLKTVTIVLLLTLISFSITFYTFNVEIYFKYIALSPFLIAIYLMKVTDKTKALYLVSLFIFISTAIHPIAIFLMITVAFVYLFRITKFNIKFINLSTILQLIKTYLIIFLPSVLLIGCWYIIGQSIMKTNIQSENSSNIYLGGIALFSWSSIYNKLLNIINLFVPDFLFHYKETMWNPMKEWLFKFTRFSLISVLSPIFFVIFIDTIRHKRNIKIYGEILILAATPLILYILFLKTYSLGGFSFFYPLSVPLILGIASDRLLEINKKTRMVLGGLYGLYMFIPIYLFSGMIIQETAHTNNNIYIATISLFIIYLALNLLLLLRLSDEKISHYISFVKNSYLKYR